MGKLTHNHQLRVTPELYAKLQEAGSQAVRRTLEAIYLPQPKATHVRYDPDAQPISHVYPVNDGGIRPELIVPGPGAMNAPAGSFVDIRLVLLSTNKQ